MNTILKTTLAIAAVTVLFTGCSVEDAISEASTSERSTSSTSSSDSTASDNITFSKTGEGFLITWTKNYESYAEIIYTDGTTGERGNGYPFTNNATGTYFLTCVQSSEDSSKVGYRCTRPDITATSSVILEKGVAYQWMGSYGFDHEHGEIEAIMEYTGGTLTIE